MCHRSSGLCPFIRVQFVKGLGFRLSQLPAPPPLREKTDFGTVRELARSSRHERFGVGDGTVLVLSQAHCMDEESDPPSLSL
jgi:hypothetical protein